jgi:hypothetical protein
MGEDTHFTQFDVLATLGNGRHLMMGDDPRTKCLRSRANLGSAARFSLVVDRAL